MVCGIMLLTAGISAYFERVVNAAPVAEYPLTAPSEQWLQSTPSAAVTWFRAEPVLPAAPDSAALWIDARDLYRVWVNGRVASTNRTAAVAGARPTGAVLDVRSLLKHGRNVIAVQVSALGEQTAALWARLSVHTASGAVELATDSGQWRATSDAAQVGARLGAPPDFITPGFPVAGWAVPVPLPPVRAVRADVPDQLLNAGTSPANLTAFLEPGNDAVYALTLDLPGSTSDVWLRVAAAGALTVSVDGRIILRRAAPGYVSLNSHRPAPLWLIPLGGRLHGGVNHLAFRVTGEGSTALAMAGMSRPAAGGAWSPISDTQQRWTVQGRGEPVAAQPLGARSAHGIWPNGFTSTDVPVAPTAFDWQAIGSSVALALLLSMLIVIVASRRRVSPQAGLSHLLICLTPAGAAIITVLAVGRWTTMSAGFPYTTGVSATVAVLLAAPLVALLVAAGLRRSRHARTALGVGQQRRHRSGPMRLPLVRPTSRIAVMLLAALAGVAQGWRIWRQPLWQDEATSIVVARSIQQHGLPKLDSGLYYFKAELYHALLALVLTISDNTSVLRAVSLFWFVATVLAFGLLLMPVLTARPSLHVIATGVLVLVPAELAWARDVRMYQQMQFFAVVFLALFIRALQRGRVRDIVGSAIALLAMYLSHEESFVLLPALPLMAIFARHVLWPRWRVFAAAFAPVAAVIAAQYALSHIHPPDFGKDLSNRPYVGWDPDQAGFYYQQVFFAPIQRAGSMAILSTLAIFGIVVALRRRDPAPRLAGIALIAAVGAVSLVFTAKVDRYSFVAIPLLVALAVLGGSHLTGALSRWIAGRDTVAGRHLDWLRLTTMTTATGIAACAVLATLVVSPRGFGVWAADVTGSPNPLSHPAYRPTVGYLRSHLQPGDQVITLAPPVMAAQYLGRSPDQVIQTGRNKLLYLVLRNGRPVDTILGRPVLLTGKQIRTFLEAHARVWLVSDVGSYLQGVPPDVRDEVTTDFRIVAQDAATTISLWNAG
jgi:hypothetical protein